MKKHLFFSNDFIDILKRAQIGYDIERFAKMNFAFSFLGSFCIALLAFLLLLRNKLPLYYSAIVFLVFFILFFALINMIPVFALSGKRSLLESDLLYSARHLLLKLESGSSLLNSLESCSKLNTKSSYYFKTIIYDVSFGTTIEDAIEKAIEYSPSKAFTKILDEIKNSLKTGADIEKTLKSTLDDVARLHLIQIQEYGKKLNPMSMFYMIVGTISPSLGTAMLVVASSLLPGILIIDMRVLLAIAFLLLVIQVFFILMFKSLKPSVIE